MSNTYFNFVNESNHDIHQYVRWERKEGKGFPLNAVIGGVGFTGETLYIGRCRLRESKFSYVPGYIDSITGVLSVPYAGKEVKEENNYEILVSDKQDHLIWKEYVTNESYRPIISNSINSLLIGRTCTKMTEGKHYRNGWIPYAALNFPSSQNFSEFDNKIPGKIDLQHECFYTAFQSKEFSFQKYEVLTVNIDPPSLAAASLCVLEPHLDVEEKKSLEEMLPHYFPKPRPEIESFIIGHGWIIDSIYFNDEPSTKVGGSGGGLTRIELEPGENIVQVKADRVSYEGEIGLARLKIKTSNDRVFGPFGCIPRSHRWVLDRININVNSEADFHNGFSLSDLQFSSTSLSGRYVTLPQQRNNETDSDSDSSYSSDDQW